MVQIRDDSHCNKPNMFEQPDASRKSASIFPPAACCRIDLDAAKGNNLLPVVGHQVRWAVLMLLMSPFAHFLLQFFFFFFFFF